MSRTSTLVPLLLLAGCASAPPPCPCPEPATTPPPAAGASEAAPDFAALFGSVVQIKVKVAEKSTGTRIEEAYEYGSGFFIDERGTILTSAHVLEHVDDPRQVTVLLGGRPLQARLGPVLREVDLATLLVDAGVTRPLEFAPGPPPLGATVFAVGFPYADVFRDHRPIVSRGQVAGVGRSIEYAGRRVSDLLLTDAFVADGCSGGPLLDDQGRVLGVLRFNLSRRGSWLGLSFAEPIGSFLRQRGE